MRENLRRENFRKEKHEKEFRERKLQERERNKEFKNLRLPNQQSTTVKEDNFVECNGMSERSKQEREATMKFIFAYSELVDADIMQGVIYNLDKDISSALIQIHERTLREVQKKPEFKEHPERVTHSKETRSYAQVLKDDNSQLHNTSSTVLHRAKTFERSIQSKLFFTNLHEDVSLIELWKKFKSVGRVRDIILPKKRDRFGKRFKFVLASNYHEASNIMSNKHIFQFKGSSIVLEWAREKSATSYHRTGEAFQSKYKATTLSHDDFVHKKDISTKQNQSEKVLPVENKESGAKKYEATEVTHIPFKESWKRDLVDSIRITTHDDFGADNLEEVLFNKGTLQSGLQKWILQFLFLNSLNRSLRKS